MDVKSKPYPVVDVFAGPGGLGEGFAICKDDRERHQFVNALSIEKDKFAYRTLLLRLFLRQFPGDWPSSYDDYLRDDIKRDDLFQEYPEEKRRAEDGVLMCALGPKTRVRVNKRIDKRLNGRKEWVLVGGPPCQAYSLVGRSRMSRSEDFAKDKRHYLYREYLQILAQHEPPVFVMENVKGLISASTHKDQCIMQRIINDLQQPAKAMKKGNLALRYKLYSFAEGREYDRDEPLQQFLVRAEDHGIPQRRHRVFIVGVRSDLRHGQITKLERSKPQSVKDLIDDLPAVRSGLSRGNDSFSEWERELQMLSKDRYMDHLGNEICDRLKKILQQPDLLPQDRQARNGSRQTATGVLSGHETRGHMGSDIRRYLFCSLYASVKGETPVLSNFPRFLLPNHKNVLNGVRGKAFSDRFRVQLADKPATTITSHISKDGHYFIHYDPKQCRSLTVREAARIQTFSDDYKFEGPRTAQYHQVGNAVPPELARQVAQRVAEVLDSARSGG